MEMISYKPDLSFGGTGESAVIIVPLDKMALDSYEAFRHVLLEIFDATTDSEETMYFRIEGLKM